MPSIGVCTVVLSENRSQVLMQKREDARLWSLPGGGVEPDETLESAAIRETLEETGYQIGIERLVAEYWRPQMDRGGNRIYVYIGYVTGGTPVKSGLETVAVEWFSIDALPSPRLPDTERYLYAALSDGEHPIRETIRYPTWLIFGRRLFFRLRNVRNWLRMRRDKTVRQ